MLDMKLYRAVYEVVQGELKPVAREYYYSYNGLFDAIYAHADGKPFRIVRKVVKLWLLKFVERELRYSVKNIIA